MYEQPAPLLREDYEALGIQEPWMAAVDAHRDAQLIDAHAEAEKIRQLGGAKGRRRAEKASAAAVRLTVQPLTAVQPRAVEWVWDQRIPAGEITLVAGKGGVGKSMLLCTLAAWLTRGTMRGMYAEQPRNVIYVANEDAADKALMPRLLAAGADPARVHTLILSDSDGDALKLTLPLHLEQLAAAVQDTQSVAVFIDPLSSNMMDRDRNSPEVRASYERLRDMADRVNVAIVGNAHTRKGQSSDLLEAIMGSSEIGNVARAALGVIRNPDSEDYEVVLSQCKNNYGPIDQKSYTYTIAPTWIVSDGGQRFEAPRIVWGESTDGMHVNDMLNEMTIVSASDVVDCAGWLKEYLDYNGSLPRQDVLREAAKQGYKEHTVKRAAKRLHVVSVQSGYPRTSKWELPAGASQNGDVPTEPTDE